VSALVAQLGDEDLAAAADALAGGEWSDQRLSLSKVPHDPGGPRGPR
jgi:hypothetical protein